MEQQSGATLPPLHVSSPLLAVSDAPSVLSRLLWPSLCSELDFAFFLFTRIEVPDVNCCQQVLHNQSALLESWPGMTGSLSAPLSCTHRFLNCRIQFSIWQEKGGSQTSQMKRQISSPLKGNSQTPPMQRAKTLFHIFGTGSSVRMIHWSRHHSGSS